MSNRPSARVRRRVADLGHRALSRTRQLGLVVRTPVTRLDRVYDVPTAEAIARLSPYTMTSPARIAALRDAVGYLVGSAVPGAFVECGVWRGGSMMAAAERLLEAGAADRELWLYDTYGGMTEPGEYDRTFDGRDASSWIAATRTRPDTNSTGVFEAPLAQVRGNLESTGYPPELLNLVPGPVEQTLYSAHVPSQIALLRLDTDFYESTRVELETLYPLLVRGGVLIVDDYGYWQGARRAVDEYFRGAVPPLVRVDESARLLVKIDDR